MSDDAGRDREDEAPVDDPADEAREVASSETDLQARRRRLWLRIGTFVAFIGVAGAFVLPRVPRSQHVRVHLGTGSSRLVRVTARISREGALDRESTFRFDHGAPPSLEWEFELPNGGADVEVELASATGLGEQRTHVELDGKELTVEAREAMGKLP
jgi:hypothetical protein